MKKLIIGVLSAAVLAFGLVPAQAATEYVATQKTLASFSASATGLTTLQRSQVKAAVEANPNAEKFICTGIRYVSQPMSENIKVRKRAKAACDYAKQLNPALSTWFQNKPTNARSYAGKVLLTVKSLQGVNELNLPADGPLSTLNNPDKAWASGQKRVLDAYSGVEEIATEITYVNGEGVDLKAVAALDRAMQMGFSLFGPRMAEGKVIVVSFSHESLDWSNEVMRSYMTGWMKWPTSTRCYGGREFSVEVDGEWRYLLHSCMPLGETDSSRLEGSVHAVTHFWQMYHAHDGQLVPAWLLEGTATLYGDVIGYGLDHEINQKIFWGGQPHLRNALRGGDSEKIMSLMKTLEGQNVSGMAHVYTLGKMILTGLSAAFGHDKIIEFTEAFGASDNFEANFVNTFGVTSEQFYRAMVPVLTSWAFTKG